MRKEAIKTTRIEEEPWRAQKSKRGSRMGRSNCSTRGSEVFRAALQLNHIPPMWGLEWTREKQWCVPRAAQLLKAKKRSRAEAKNGGGSGGEGLEARRNEN